MANRTGTPSFHAPRGVRVVLAHRGGGILSQQNSLDAFAHALSLGLSVIETDVRATRDGVALIVHDPVLLDVTGDHHSIDELTLAELRALPFDPMPPTLAEALERFPDAYFNIDLKDWGSVGPVAAVVSADPRPERLCLTSFAERRVRRVARLVPEQTSLGVGTGRVCVLLGLAAVRARPLFGLVVRSRDVLQLPGRVVGWRSFGRLVRYAHARRVAVQIWTLNEPAEIRAAFTAGADGVITDRPEVALDCLS